VVVCFIPCLFSFLSADVDVLLKEFSNIAVMNEWRRQTGEVVSKFQVVLAFLLCA
jgi:hypothetical protein